MFFKQKSWKICFQAKLDYLSVEKGKTDKIRVAERRMGASLMATARKSSAAAFGHDDGGDVFY